MSEKYFIGLYWFLSRLPPHETNTNQHFTLIFSSRHTQPAAEQVSDNQSDAALDYRSGFPGAACIEAAKQQTIQASCDTYTVPTFALPKPRVVPTFVAAVRTKFCCTGP